MNTSTRLVGPRDDRAAGPSLSLLKQEIREADVPGVLGRVESLSDAEQAELQANEAVILMGWQTFVEVGIALARIRDAHLYRCVYPNFEAYCRDKWECSRRRVEYLISAAQLFRHLRTNCSQVQPEHESQLRPLMGLSPEQARLAWQRAVEMAGHRRMTARVVRSAVQDLRFSGAPPKVAGPTRRSKAQIRGLIDAAIGELLVLVGQRASPSVMTVKLEALHRHVGALFGGSSKERS